MKHMKNVTKVLLVSIDIRIIIAHDSNVSFFILGICLVFSLNLVDPVRRRGDTAADGNSDVIPELFYTDIWRFACC